MIEAPGSDGRWARPVLVVAAHPDDETIGAGVLLAESSGSVVVHVTDGAPRDPRFRPAAPDVPREAYAAARRAEVCEALALAGVTPDCVLCLGAVDLEAALIMATLARRLADVLADVRPELVVMHPYEGGHPDHDAAALVAHASAALLRERGVEAPELAEMTSYHAGGGHFETGVFLDPCLAAAPGPRCLCASSRELGASEQRLKRAMLDRFRTQSAVLAAFSVDAEPLRWAPRYDFTRPPHEGQLYYERLGMPPSGERFRSLAHEALWNLGLAGAPI